MPSTSQDAAWSKVVEAATKEGKVTVYSFNLVSDAGLAVIKTFKERYGITVDIITGRGAEFAERLKTEKRIGQQTGDFTEGSPVQVKNMKLEGLTVSVAELPVLRETEPWIIRPESLDSTDKHVISHYVTTFAPWVNTKLVKREEEPKVWRDLLKPRWKSKMSLIEYKISGGPYLLFVPLLREKIIDIDYIKALNSQDLLFAGSLVDETGRLARGDRELMIRGSDTQSSFVTEGAPLRAIEMEDGTPLSPGGAAVISGAPHPNAAKLFANWFISAEGQIILGKYRQLGRIRKDIPDFRPEPIRFTPKRPIVVTVEDNEESTRLFREKWLDKLWGK